MKRKSPLPLFLIFCSALMLTIGAEAKIFKTKCEGFYTNSMIESAKTSIIGYYSEVKRTRGAALVVRDPKPVLNYPIPLFTAPDPNNWALDKALQYVPNRLTNRFYGQVLDFRPGRWFIDKAIQTPTRKVSDKAFGKAKEISSLLIFLASFGSSVAVLDHVYNRIDQTAEVNQQIEIQKKSPEYQILLTSDFRFTNLRLALSKLSLTDADRATFTFNWNEALRDFYKYVDSEYSNQVKKDFRKANHNILSQTRFGKIIFADIEKLIQDGISPNLPGFIYQPEFSTKLNELQVNQLIGLRIEMLGKMEIVGHYVFKTETYTKYKEDPAFNEIFKSWDQDPFIQELRRLQKQGKIEPSKLRFLIQEDLHWRNSLEQWKVLGVTRLKFKDDSFSNQPLTIQDIQTETLANL